MAPCSDLTAARVQVADGARTAFSPPLERLRGEQVAASVPDPPGPYGAARLRSGSTCVGVAQRSHRLGGWCARAIGLETAKGRSLVNCMMCVHMSHIGSQTQANFTQAHRPLRQLQPHLRQAPSLHSVPCQESCRLLQIRIGRPTRIGRRCRRMGGCMDTPCVVTTRHFPKEGPWSLPAVGGAGRSCPSGPPAATAVPYSRWS